MTRVSSIATLRSFTLLAISFFIAGFSSVQLLAQAYTCPEDPDWSAVPCSVHKAFTPGAGEFIPYHLRLAEMNPNYVWWSMEMFGINNNIEIQIWHSHFDSQQKIAKLVADSIAILPPVILRALPINTLISMDVGSGTGAIYWNLWTERAHAIEFAAVFAHEADDTLDWAFEELLLHEIGHVFDVGLYKISENVGWLNASNKDFNALVSEYADTNAKEAFAETFAAWVSFSRDAARPENERRLTHVHRTHILDAIFYRGAWIDEHVLSAAYTPYARLFTSLAPLAPLSVPSLKSLLASGISQIHASQDTISHKCNLSP